MPHAIAKQRKGGVRDRTGGLGFCAVFGGAHRSECQGSAQCQCQCQCQCHDAAREKPLPWFGLGWFQRPRMKPRPGKASSPGSRSTRAVFVFSDSSCRTVSSKLVHRWEKSRSSSLCTRVSFSTKRWSRLSAARPGSTRKAPMRFFVAGR